MAKIATKKNLKDLIENDVENVYDLHIPQRNDIFDTYIDLKYPLTDDNIEKILTLFYNGITLLILENIQNVDVNRNKFPHLWEVKAEQYHLWLKNILKSVDDNFSISLVTNFLFKDFEKYLLDSLYRVVFIQKN